MHIYRVEFDLRSALPGKANRQGCWRMSQGARLVSTPTRFTDQAAVDCRVMIEAEARRLGLKDVQVRVKRAVELRRVDRKEAAAAAPAAAGVH